jgi:mannose-1-phosphate guanylyltransferase
MRNSGLVSDFIYTGTAVFSPEIFRFLRHDFSGIVDTGFTGLIDHGGLGYMHHHGFWQDIGTLANFHLANLDNNFRILMFAERMKSSIGMLPHMVSEHASIESGTRVVDAVIGGGCIIQSGANVENSVLLPGTVVEKGALIRDSIAWRHGVIPVNSLTF